MVDSREARIIELEKENATLRDRIVIADTEVFISHYPQVASEYL